MATVMLTLHAKQPKRGTLAFDKAYVEVYEYPRVDKAVITWTKDGRRKEVLAVSTAEHSATRSSTWSRPLQEMRRGCDSTRPLTPCIS